MQPAMPNAATLLTTREVAVVMRVHPRTLERWRARGVGPTPLRIGVRTVRYPRVEVERCIRIRAAA